MKELDVIVVGAGATGGWAAKCLTESGLTVGLLDAGPNSYGKEEFQESLRGTLFGEKIFASNEERIVPNPTRASEMRQSIQQECYAFNSATKNLFVDDIDNPYEVPYSKPFSWIRSRQVGGRSNLWARVALRMSDCQLKGSGGGRPPWPVSYNDLSEHYVRVERFLHIAGFQEGQPIIPDSIISEPGLPVQQYEDPIRRAAQALWPGPQRVCRLREATLTQPGVSTISRDALPYFSSAGSTIPSAKGTGLLYLFPNAVVSKISTTPDGSKARTVEYINALTGEQSELAARVFILCASALETTRILLNSRSYQHTNGLCNSSGMLGHQLMDHACGVWIKGKFGTPIEDGSPSAKIYIPPVRAKNDSLFGAQGVCDSKGVSLIAFGEMLPRYENNVSISTSLRDRWGIPSLKIDCEFSSFEKEGAERWLDDMRSLLRESGYEEDSSNSALSPPGSAIHEVGTARMGHDPRTSILDGYCRSWDIGNLFVTDGAAFPSVSFQNPTLTMLALTDRSCSYIARNFHKEYK